MRALTLLLLLLAAPADAQSRAERRAAERAAWVPDGEPVDCLQIAQIRETRVFDDRTIDFILRDGRVFRNELPQRCPQLGFEESFAYQTSITQLCSVDIITVIQRGGTIQRGASCGLGRFQPVKAADVRK
ncbi:hypothetical protein [Thermaurantiacus sp.]